MRLSVEGHCVSDGLQKQRVVQARSKFVGAVLHSYSHRRRNAVAPFEYHPVRTSSASRGSEWS